MYADALFSNFNIENDHIIFLYNDRITNLQIISIIQLV
jgi:hypothetical protein